MANKNFAVKNGLDVAGDATLTGDLTVLGADIKGPSSTTALTLDQYGNVNVAGDLTISGNELYSGSGRIAYLVGTELELTGSLRIDGNTLKASDNATNITMTSNTLTTFAGDIKVTGNDIVSSSGATALTLSGSNVSTTGQLTANTVNVNSQSLIASPGSISTNSTSEVVLDSFAKATYTTAKYIIQATQTNIVHSSEALVIHDGTTAYVSVYADTNTGTALYSNVTADISGSNVRLLVTPSSSTATTFKVFKIQMT